MNTPKRARTASDPLFSPSDSVPYANNGVEPSDVRISIADACEPEMVDGGVALTLRGVDVQPIPEGMVDSLHRMITDAGFHPYDAEEAVEAACEALQAASIARALAKRVRLHR